MATSRSTVILKFLPDMSSKGNILVPLPCANHSSLGNPMTWPDAVKPKSCLWDVGFKTSKWPRQIHEDGLWHWVCWIDHMNHVSRYKSISCWLMPVFSTQNASKQLPPELHIRGDHWSLLRNAPHMETVMLRRPTQVSIWLSTLASKHAIAFMPRKLRMASGMRCFSSFLWLTAGFYMLLHVLVSCHWLVCSQKAITMSQPFSRFMMLRVYSHPFLMTSHSLCRKSPISSVFAHLWGSAPPTAELTETHWLQVRPGKIEGPKKHSHNHKQLVVFDIKPIWDVGWLWARHSRKFPQTPPVR